MRPPSTKWPDFLSSRSIRKNPPRWRAFSFTYYVEFLAQFFHALLEHFAAWSGGRLRQRRQRLVGHVEQIEKRRRLRIDVEDSREHLLLLVRFEQTMNGVDPVG